MNNNGYLLLWSVVVLMIVSMVVLSYANTVNTNYNIVESIYRGERASQMAYGGFELAISHYKQNPSNLYNLNNELIINEIREVYTVTGEDLSNYTILQDYEIDSVEVEKISENRLSISVISLVENAKRTVYSEITINSESDFSVEKLKVN